MIYPLRYDQEAQKNALTIELTEQEERDRRSDYEEIRAEKKYHQKYHEDWRRAGAQYNMIQEGLSDDPISNIYLGLARMVIDQGIGMMTEGQPEFDYEPVGPSDHKKVILWKALVEYLLSECSFKAHQDRWITDLHVFGSSPLEVYVQTPTRLRRYEREDGTIEEKLARDFRRCKVGIRHRPIFYTYRNPNITDPDDVPSATYEEFLTRSQFTQNYANVFLAEGKPKYKNIKQLLSLNGTHVKVTTHFNEITDVLRIYAIPYGTTLEGSDEAPPDHDLGLPILDKPLCFYRSDKNGLVTSGANVPGMVPLCFGSFNDQLDKSLKTHAVYGMGIPQLIDGPEAVMQALFNMTIDNMRLKNTVPIAYKSFDGKTSLDIDMGMMYSGMLVDGEISAQPLGTADVSSNGIMWEWINNICIWLTGINFQQLGGDSSKTAFEFAQRIRANNQRAEKRIRQLENGPLKRAGMLLLANGLSETTTEEWEDLTEMQVEDIAGRIGSKDVPAQDYEFNQGKPVKRRVHSYIPVKGHKFREDFKTPGQPGKRQLNYGKTNNTLIRDNDLEGDTSYVPATKEYLYPTGDIESILHFNVKVDGRRMLGDLKAQDMEMMDKIGAYFTNRFMAFAQMPDQLPDVDMKKLDQEMLKFTNIDPEKVASSVSDGSAMLKEARSALDEIEALSTQPYVPQPPAVPGQPPADPANAVPAQTNPLSAAAPTGAALGAQKPFTAAAQGRI